MGELVKHFCTGCGMGAIGQCRECGEWRCIQHLTIGGWCIPDDLEPPNGTKRGEHCAGPRDHGEHRCRFMAPGDHWHRPVRLVCHTLVRGGLAAVGRVPIWMCSGCLGTWAERGWRWREEPVATPVSHCHNCGKSSEVIPLGLRGDGNFWCFACYEKHLADQKKVVEGSNFTFESPASDSPVVARYYKEEPKTASAASPRFFVTYCSSAPPQELVERVLVRRGSGLHLGEPVMAPLVWSGPRAREWERHVAFAPNGYVQAHRLVGSGTPMTEFHPGTVVDDRDVEVPLDAIPVDQFGGRVFTGLRCRLCGGWLRLKELVR
jgi:hypothetical protein